MRSALALVIALLTAHIQAEGPQATNPHARLRPILRPMHERVEMLIATGMDRSATFRQLVRRIERSDVIVYVEARHDMRDGVGGSMRFIARSATDRFVRIQLNADYSNHTLVALLGHELQHVVEVADHAEVQSPATCASSIGARACGPGPTASTPKRRGKPAIWSAPRSQEARATCAWRAAPASTSGGCSTAARSPPTTTTGPGAQ